jgi:hypothetical protein
MFRVKTTRRNVKRAISPLKPSSSAFTDLSGAPINVIVSTAAPQPTVPVLLAQEPAEALEKHLTNFFEAESAAVSLSKPWLRLERGLRLQKFRAFAEAYPGLNTAEKDALYKMLVKANDTKLLNTKAQIAYENGAIQSIKGLKVIRTGDPTAPATFKIEVARSTKKNTED